LNAAKLAKNIRFDKSLEWGNLKCKRNGKGKKQPYRQYYKVARYFTLKAYQFESKTIPKNRPLTSEERKRKNEKSKTFGEN